MTKKEAEKQGLIFTGTYVGYYSSHRNIEEVAEEAKRIRKLGYRAVTVEEENGKSVYAERSYLDYEIAQQYKQRLEYTSIRKQSLMQEYEQKLRELEVEEKMMREFIAKVENK